ncbi:MAG: hypothetical protein COA43_08625 [Robiginitomaculum sp.]|nr:MAG: hypothetical protein COA43_08625 [Robiginitomaculum sp.]
MIYFPKTKIFFKGLLMKITHKMSKVAFGLALMFGTVIVSQTFAPVAYAQTQSAKSIVDKAKTDGLVGETLSGYLALVTSTASTSVKSAVNEINIRRKSVYTKHARATGESVSDVAGVSGEKLINKAKLGEKVKLANGVWTTR